MDSVNHIARAANRFFSGTALSRVTGMVREVVMAAAFGSLPAVAAFMMAFRFANLLRRLLGEGAMNSAFIPQFEELRLRSPARAGIFFKSLSLSLSLFLFLLTLLVEMLICGWLWLGSLSENNAEILRYTAIMLPAIIAICLYGLNSAFLNCEKVYFTPSVAPAIFNMMWIVGLAWLWKREASEAMILLSSVVVVAFVGQWLVTVPKVVQRLRTLVGKSQKNSLWKEDLKRLGKPLFLGILGVGATQINSAIDPLFARAADVEGPAFLWYALRLQQLPLSLFGIAMTGALLPALSRAIKAGDRERSQHFLHFAVTRSFGLILPCMLAIMVLGLTGVNLIYGRGAFDQVATQETALCLWAYGWAILPTTLALIFASLFYAQGNYRVPALASAFAVVVNIVFNAIAVFGFGLGAASVAFATSASAFFQCGYLARKLTQRGEGVIWAKVIPSASRVLYATLTASIATALFGFFFLNDPGVALLAQRSAELPRDFITQFSRCAAESICFLLVLLFAAWMWRAEDLRALLPSRPRKEQNSRL